MLSKTHIKLRPDAWHGINSLISTAVASVTASTDVDDLIFCSLLIQVSDKISGKLCKGIQKPKERISFTPAEALAMHQLYVYYGKDTDPYTHAHLQTVSNLIHQKIA